MDDRVGLELDVGLDPRGRGIDHGDARLEVAGDDLIAELPPRRREIGTGVHAFAHTRTIALGLVIGGSIANLLDRVRLGHVTDFLDFAYWPAFNLADTFIVVGVGLLFASFVAADRASPRVGTAPLSRS